MHSLYFTLLVQLELYLKFWSQWEEKKNFTHFFKTLNMKLVDVLCECVCVCLLLGGVCCCSDYRWEWNRWQAQGNHVFLWSCSDAANCADDGLHSHGIHCEYGTNKHTHTQLPRVFSEKHRLLHKSSTGFLPKKKESTLTVRVCGKTTSKYHLLTKLTRSHPTNTHACTLPCRLCDHQGRDKPYRGLVARYSKRALGWWVNRGRRQLANQHCCP